MQPLALVFFQRPLPGNQLVNRLQDLGYRVQTANVAEKFQALAQTAGAMLALVDVEGAREELFTTMGHLRQGEATQHLPILAFAVAPTALENARKAGCTVVVETSALLTHLEAFLEQALRID